MLRDFLNRLKFPGRGAARPRAASRRTAIETADRLIVEGNRAESEGRLREACELYRRAVAAAPGWGKAHLNLGIGLEAMGDIDGAVGCHERALANDPADPYANYNLGRLLYTRGQLPRGEQLLRQALRSRPEFPQAHVVLARVLEAQGNLDAAAAALEAVLKLRPDDISVLHHYAEVVGRLNRADEAQAALKRVIALDPENADANYSLATLLLTRGEFDDAEPLLRRVVRRDPNSVEAHSRLFDIYHSRGDLSAAVAELERVLELRPDWADALCNYGLVLKGLRRLREAESAFRRAVAADPGHSPAYRMLGGVLLGQCRAEEAFELYTKARQLCPEDLDLESAELFALNASDHAADDVLFEKHVAFGARIERAFPARFEPFRNSREPERRLRIGYVSGDFCYHVVTLFMKPMIERHDRSAYEVFCYSTGSSADDYTRQLSARADVWREAASVSESELANVVNRDAIDILVDLGGHSGIPQLAVFAQQPAPVQVTWLGYLNTTGMTRIQYRISDHCADPPGLTDHRHTETLVRLPHSQWCYRPFLSIPSTKTPPFVQNGYITFGSFNQAFKISRTARRLWREILERLPDSRLVIIGIDAGRAEDELLADLAGAAVDRARITVRPYVSLEDYFRSFDAVDMTLDTTPCSGGTTTCDSRWMGVPVITSPGTRSVSRSAASILTSAGLTEWIASGPEDYVRLAVEFAREEKTITQLRASLRRRMRESPLMDEAGFVRDVESAYRRMWQAWCSKSN